MVSLSQKIENTPFVFFYKNKAHFYFLTGTLALCLGLASGSHPCSPGLRVVNASFATISRPKFVWAMVFQLFRCSILRFFSFPVFQVCIVSVITLPTFHWRLKCLRTLRPYPRCRICAKWGDYLALSNDDMAGPCPLNESSSERCFFCAYPHSC